MPKICYVRKNFRESSLVVIEQANEIITEYAAQGFDLTLRQLYYQFVSRALISNSDREYKRLGGIINDARLAGLIDWDAIQDRTRNLETLSHWGSPENILEESAKQFRMDKWAGQPFRPEVWMEKDAVIGIVAPVCERLDVPYFSCRGYTSQSEMWVGGRRMRQWHALGATPVVLHLGDHDPSGIDMTRDVTERLALFAGEVAVKRLALNMDQVDQYGPPPNPAKTTDSRYIGYTELYGDESWELDALEPQAMADLIENAVLALRQDDDAYEAVLAEEQEAKSQLEAIADNWNEVGEYLEGINT